MSVYFLTDFWSQLIAKVLLGLRMNYKYGNWPDLLIFREGAPDKVTVSLPASGSTVDVGVVRYNAKEILPANIQAKPEEGEVIQKLIPTLSDAEIEEVSGSTFYFFKKIISYFLSTNLTNLISNYVHNTLYIKAKIWRKTVAS